MFARLLRRRAAARSRPVRRAALLARRLVGILRRLRAEQFFTAERSRTPRLRLRGRSSRCPVLPRCGRRLRLSAGRGACRRLRAAAPSRRPPSPASVAGYRLRRRPEPRTTARPYSYRRCPDAGRRRTAPFADRRPARRSPTVRLRPGSPRTSARPPNCSWAIRGA